MDVINRHLLKAFLIVVLIAFTHTVFAAVLPEERADIMYHEYDGGGVTISGPSVLVRKSVLENVSVSANYYVDSISSASIDVQTSGSPYSEERTEQSIGVDVLNDKSILSVTYTNSLENDYDANTFGFGVSQEFFGGLTTLSLGYGFGNDDVSKTGESDFSESLDRQNYRMSLSQVLSRKLILGLNLETITEEGYLQNPYREVRYDTGAPNGTWAPEKYPRTRTSDAISLRLRYYMNHRAAFRSEFRFYTDSWGINARNLELGYTHPLDEYPLIIDVKYRYYRQNKAFFFTDFINDISVLRYYGRDKELSALSSTSLGVGLKWEVLPNGWHFLEKASVSFYYDYIQFIYDDFRDATKSGYELGQEPFYEFDAGVTRLFFTGNY